VTAQSIGTTVLGYPRIGPNRELKKAVEAYWAGRIEAAELHRVGRDLRADTWRSLRGAGLDSIPSNTFSFYDQVLDTATMLGAIPPRHSALGLDELDTYFSMARGNDDATPLEMTKWFDTNYHYLVPELGPDTTFRLNATKPLAEFAEARSLGITTRPVVLGPVSFLLLAKPTVPDFDPLTLVDRLVPAYSRLLGQLHEAGAEWIQLDEPAFVNDRRPQDYQELSTVYSELAGGPDRPRIFVASYFGDLGDALPVLAATPVEAIGVDLVHGKLPSCGGLRDKTVVAGVINGRNIWRTDLDAALDRARALVDIAGEVAVSPSCSLQHVPYSLRAEARLDDDVRSWLAFAEEKVAEVVAVGAALRGSRDTRDGRVIAAFDGARAVLAARAAAPRNNQVRDRIAALRPADSRRGSADVRAKLQREQLDLPVLPTTTIGSFPQTAQLRTARADLRAGRLDEAGYAASMRAEVERVIRLQEELGLDVLVHGEPERNDMVQYFAEQLDGYAFTEHGWVQSYGSRCTRPPILYGDVSRPRPMTVDWATYAQSLTDRPVKGMLTGPVTMLAWSFVRDDQPRAETAFQVALALREEVSDLEQAGLRIIQVDEPALRELLPPRAADRPSYLDWAVTSFRLATSGVSDSTQIHTHLCYSEFGEILGAIDGLDADVTSIEAARSTMEVVADLAAGGFARGVGPGVYDIHSPRVPSTEEVEKALRITVEALPADRIWVNPDCGLKTRNYAQVEPALRGMVQAARKVRAEI
jgi:5-methyltetrahydropteroyltriglutamate--homocysteine methyltransferase